MNNINDLFKFYFGPQGDEIRAHKGSLSKSELKEIILNYSLADLYQVQENQTAIFTLQINEETLDFRYEFFSEHPMLRIFAQVAVDFKNELDALIDSFKFNLAPKEADTMAFLNDLLYNSLLIDYSEGGGDKFVAHLNSIKQTNPEAYQIFKTFMTHRPQIWSGIVSSTQNRNTPSDKMKKIVFALIEVMSSGYYYVNELKESKNFKAKDFISLTDKLTELSDSPIKFLCYLLKDPRRFPLTAI